MISIHVQGRSYRRRRDCYFPGSGGDLLLFGPALRFADRILFGTDISRQPGTDGPEATAERYRRCFRLLETDQTVDHGFFGGEPAVGLALPTEVLEKIYYRNAVRLYPRVGESLSRLGYDIDLPAREKKAVVD